MNTAFRPRGPARKSSSRNLDLKWRRRIQCVTELWLGSTGCGVAEKSLKLPVNAMSAVMPSAKPTATDPALLQTELQRFADEFSSRTIAALDDYAQQLGTPAAHRQALQWKISPGSAVLGIASGPNPLANLLDFVAMATVARTALEEVWVKTTNGSAFHPWLAASRTLETNAWKLAGGILKPEQQQELRAAISHCWDANPGVQTRFFARPEELSTLIRQSAEKSAQLGSVFSLTWLDPTAGLDPAVREVTRTRLFAERAMFMAQRMPSLVRWQIELMADQLLREPQLAAALDSADRISRATESVSQAAAQLPDRITAERKAILAALETQEGRLRELSGEVTRTLAAGEKMSASLNTTVTSFDALMNRFKVGETNKTVPPGTNAEPFRIQDYGRTAMQLEAAARQLTELLRTLDQTLGSSNLSQLSAQVAPVVQQAHARGKELVDYAFWKGLIFLAIALIAAWLYRFLGTRMTATNAKSAAP